jgi:hypothetical protein
MIFGREVAYGETGGKEGGSQDGHRRNGSAGAD